MNKEQKWAYKKQKQAYVDPGTDPDNGSGEEKYQSNPASGRLPHDLIVAIRDVYEPAGMKAMDAVREAEGSEYGACRLSLDGNIIAFRVAKTTPAKIGQFVTIWKRQTADCDIAPLDVSDD